MRYVDIKKASEDERQNQTTTNEEQIEKHKKFKYFSKKKTGV